MKLLNCPECIGGGEIECDQCGSTMDCPDCCGTGLDDGQIDTKAWDKADQEFTRLNGCSWGWYEDGVCMGREARNGKRLVIADFAREA